MCREYLFLPNYLGQTIGACQIKTYICDMKPVKLLPLLPLLRIVLALILGIIIGDAVGERVPMAVWLGLAAVVVGVAFLVRKGWEWLQGVCIMGATLLLGAALMTGENRHNAPLSTPQDLDYEAVVMSKPTVRGRTLRCDLAITRIGQRLLHRPILVKAAILRDTATNRWQQLRLGDGLQARSKLDAPRSFYAASHFDYVRWLRSHGFRAQTFIYYSHWHKASVSMAPLSRFARFRLRALLFRQRLLARYRLLGLDSQQLAVVAAMTLGDRSGISQATKEAYSVSGASHVLALSGLHLGIIYAILTMLLGWNRRWRWLSQTIILAGIWMFVVLVGLPPSAIRSATMLSLCSLCILLGRQQVSVNTLAFAALVMLVAHPSNLWDVGFQMSFMAVLAIMVYFRPLFHLLTLQNPLSRWFWGLTVVSFAAQIGTAPLVIYYFGRYSCYFLLTNFVVIPTTTLILYGAVALLLSAPFLPLQKAIALCLAHLATFLNSALATFARLPGASIEGICINTLQLYLIYIVILSLTVLTSYALKIRTQKHLEAFFK